MRAQGARSSTWVCTYCEAPVPPGWAHKCLEYDRDGQPPCSADVAYLWPSRNLREVAERIEEKAIEGAARTGRGVLGFLHDSNIRDIEAAFNVALHLRRIAAASADTLPKGEDAKQASCASKGSAVGAAETPNSTPMNSPHP